jgi:hypothetical protein
MALIDKASLLMVPSTYEAGKLYNVLPSGNRAPDSTDQNSGYDKTRADFDFDRGTDHGATRIGSDGLLKKYRENVLLQSNQFDTTWYNSNSTETGGQEDKDGGTDAWLLTKTSTNGGIRQNNTTSGVQTFSFYAKAGDSNWVKVNNLGSSAYHQANFDLVNGVVGTTDYIIDAKIEDYGNGWYRCITTYNTTLANIDVRVADSDNVVSGTTGSIFIQSAQLETGLVSTDYLDSTSVTGKAGVLVDLPRINYDANGENGALLLEPSRQQLIQYSEYFGDSSWTKGEVTTTDNAVESPDGYVNAAAMVENSALTAYRRILPTSPFLATASAYYSFSVYVKKIAGQPTRHIYWMCQKGADAIYAHFDMDDFSVNEQNDSGTGSVVDADIVPVGNDWYRLTLSGIVTTAGGSSYNQLYFEDSPSTGFNPTPYTGNGSSGYYLYGWQIEAGSYVSSYIPNHGESGGVTRAADSCSVTGASDVIGQTEGVIYFEWDYQNVGSSGGNIVVSLAGASLQELYFWVKTDGSLVYDVYDSTKQAGIIGSIGSFGIKKVALAYKNNDFALYINGILIGSDTSGSVPTLTDIFVGRYAINTNYNISSGIKQVALFKERLSNAELAALTA